MKDYSLKEALNIFCNVDYYKEKDIKIILNTLDSIEGMPILLRRKINARNFKEAERDLFTIFEDSRTAEWHYLESIILMHRNRVNDAMRELEIACSMDPSNIEYQKAKEMFNNTAGGYGSTYYGSATRPARTSSDDACDCCANLLCMDCLCECMGGDLISCC